MNRVTRILAALCIVGSASTCFANVGGPDAFGYYFVDNQGGDSASFAWIELCGDPNAINGPTGHNNVSCFSWGWNFPFYGTNYTSGCFSTNGLMTMLGANSSGANVCGLSGLEPPWPTLYPYWDDLRAAAVGGCVEAVGPWLRYRDFGSYLVLEWKRIQHNVNSTDRYSFEAILFPDGRIKFQYNMDWLAPQTPNSATIGIDAPGAGNGLEYVCNAVPASNTILPGRAMWFYMPPPPPMGRCCYGTICVPLCADSITSADCAGLGGTWAEGATCANNPCGGVPSDAWSHGGKGYGGGSPLTDATVIPANDPTINQAIDNIQNRQAYYPDVESEKVDGSRRSIKRSEIADKLRKQLNAGHMKKDKIPGSTLAETVADGSAETAKDVMTIDSGLINAAASGSMGILEEVLVHEFVHKIQTRNGVDANGYAREFEARDAEIFYKLEILFLAINDPFVGSVSRLMWLARWNYLHPDQPGGPRKSLHDIHNNNAYFVTPSDQLAGDTLTSVQMPNYQISHYDLSPLAVTDMMAVASENPDGCNLLLAGVVGGYTGRITGLSMVNGQVVGTIATNNFPMPIYSMTRLGTSNAYFLTDTSQSQILVCRDTNFDMVPDLITGVFATSAEFPELEGLHTAEPATHPIYGFGILTGIGNMDLSEERDAYDPRFFLPDANCDFHADAVIPVHIYEFLDYVPVVMPPWDGNDFVDMRAQWRHDIAVYASDSSGQNLGDLLGSVRITAGMDTIFQISRALNTGEHVIAVDQTTGERPPAAALVVDPTPRGLVIHNTLATDSLPDELHFDWDEVPSAAYYLIFGSPDGLNFTATGDTVYWHDFDMPLPAAVKYYYRVEAHR